jgi:AcrR family transcriptional regulator
MGTVTSLSTPERLLDAAERLMAELGVEAVSVRAVNAMAGRNAAAVHYHFGSKEALVRAALARRMEVLAARRASLVEALDGVARPSSRQLAEVLVQPLADVRRDESWGVTYVRFLGALSEAGQPWQAMTAELFESQREMLDHLVHRTLPELTEPVRRFRLRFAMRSAIATLADLEPYEELLGPGERDASDAAVAALIECLAGGLGAPGEIPARSRRAS